MKRNSKEIYTAPRTSVDEIIDSEMLCISNDATNESFEEEIDIEW